MNSKSKNVIILWSIVGLLITGGLIFLVVTSSGAGELDTFAKCLGEKGAVFYGAYWCPHCQNQKAMFGKSQEFLPYVECSTPDGEGQTEICQEKGVQGYPTWEFADGSRLSGEIPLSQLAEKTGCELPK